jgi:hypothetical protein
MFLDSFHWEAKTSVRIFWVKVIFLILSFLSQIFKLLRGPRIDSKEPIPPGCVAWRAGKTTLFLLGS